MQRCLGCMKEYEAEFDLCPFCGYIKDTPAKSRNHLEPGTEIANRYIIGKSLGQGGFGITYIAWDNKIQKTVTIKEFFPNALSTRGSGEVSVSCFNDRAEAHFKEGMKKMLDEGRRLSKFTDNENIVDVYDFFEENNTSYIVMEYLSGKDLKQFLEEKGGKLDPEEAVKIILPILNALSDMHKAQLIHRDVAPDNIFLCDNGKIKLLDFGSARLAVDENEKSLSIMLKHGFAPKEQYSSRSNQGPWTDVYAVCATLYKMITGEVPPDSIDRKSDSLKPLSAFGINGYAALEEVITKGLEVESEDRYQDVKTLKKELVLGLEKKNSIITKKESDNPAKTNNTNGKKNGKKIIIAAVAALVLVAGLVSGILFTNKFKKDETTEVSSTTNNKTYHTTSNSEIVDTESTSANTQVEPDTDNTWKDAYIQILRNSKSGAGYSFGLGFVDNDNIPELFITESLPIHPTKVEVYTYYNDEAVLLCEGGSGGEIGYIEREGFVCGYYEGMGTTSNHVYEVKDGKAELIYSTYHAYDVWEHPEVHEHEINDKTVSSIELKDLINKYFKDKTSTIKKYESIEENYKKYITDFNGSVERYNFNYESIADEYDCETIAKIEETTKSPETVKTTKTPKTSQTTKATAETTVNNEPVYDLTGTCGDNVYWGWNKSTSHMDVWGTGNMKNGTMSTRYEIDNIFVVDGNGTLTEDDVLQITSVEIHYGVKSIGDFSFFMFNNLKKIIISNSITKIGAYSLCNNQLEEVTIPHSVISIGKGAFASCNKLKIVRIPYSVIKIGLGAFELSENPNITIYVENRSEAPSDWVVGWASNNVKVVWYTVN